MAEQVQKHRMTAQQQREAEEVTQEDIAAKGRTSEQQALLEEDILADIDTILEENEEALLNYRQVGGQ